MSEDTLKLAMLADRREAEKMAQRQALYARLEQLAEAREETQAVKGALPRKPSRPAIRTVEIAS